MKREITIQKTANKINEKIINDKPIHNLSFGFFITDFPQLNFHGKLTASGSIGTYWRFWL